MAKIKRFFLLDAKYIYGTEFEIVQVQLLLQSNLTIVFGSISPNTGENNTERLFFIQI